MARPIRLAVPLCACAITVGSTVEPPAARNTPRKPSTSSTAPGKPADPMAAVRALRIKLPSIDVHDLPFDEFTAWLARQGSINVVPRWRQLEKAGIKRDTPVTVELKDATLGDALRKVLQSLADRESPLAFRTEENIITISSKADLDRQLMVKVYDVQDLLIQTPNFRGLLPELDDSGMQLRESSAGDQLKGADEATRELADILTTHVYPDSWKVHGGLGTISYLRGRLVVRNTPEVHEALSGQLRALRN